MSNRTKIIAALAFVRAASSKFSAELREVIQTGNFNLSRHTMYVRVNATGASSSWDVIDSNTKKIDGVSSISESKLPKNQAFVFDKVAIGFAEGDAENLEGALDYNSTKAPAVLRNAVLVITQNGREVLEIPVSELVKVISPANQEDYYHDLEGFHYIVDDQPMQQVIKFPNGQTLSPSAAGKFNYLEVRAQGYKTTKKQ